MIRSVVNVEVVVVVVVVEFRVGPRRAASATTTRGWTSEARRLTTQAVQGHQQRGVEPSNGEQLSRRCRAGREVTAVMAVVAEVAVVRCGVVRVVVGASGGRRVSE